MKIRVSGPDEEGAVVVVKLVGDAWPPTGQESLGTSTTGLLLIDRSGTCTIAGGGAVGTGVAVGTGDEPEVGVGTEVGDSAGAGVGVVEAMVTLMRLPPTVDENQLPISLPLESSAIAST